jgi:hypothetical protein
MSKVLFVGLDVHAGTIAVAVAETGGEVRSLGVISNRLESVRKLVGKLGRVEHLRACYEAGPRGYVLYWQLTQLGVACEVIAPTGAYQGRRPGEDGPARRREVGALLPRRRTDCGVGAGCRSRSFTRSGAGAVSGEEGPAESAPGQSALHDGQCAGPTGENGAIRRSAS